MADKKVVIAGATGLVGNAALRHLGRAGGCDVVALSRRKPRGLYGARHVSTDLTDQAGATGIEALTVSPTFSTRYKDEAPKTMPNTVPMIKGIGVSSRSWTLAGI